MMTLITAVAVAAAQPATIPMTAPAPPAPTMKMGESQEQRGQMADMKDCCCKDMAKMHEGHSAGHSPH